VTFAAGLALASTLASQDSRPSISYGGSRTSSRWIETSKGSVAVDEGVAWKGVKVYLSLTWDLVAVDEATGKTLWLEPVGAFWNEIGFAEIETAPGRKAWTVELRPGRRSGEGAALRQHHDLLTGKRVAAPEAVPSGKALDTSSNRHGRWSAIATPVRKIVGSADEWKTFVLDTMFASLEPPRLPPVDFEKSVVLIISHGDGFNCNGLEASAWEDEQRILVRLRALTFQTMGPDGGGQRVRPWGIFVLPRTTPFKTVIVERNAQNLIGGPPLWRELCTFDAPGDPRPAPPKPRKSEK
jgi:hypothetical protein